MKKIIMQPSGKEIDCPSGETVLSVLEKQGYAWVDEKLAS